MVNFLNILSVISITDMSLVSFLSFAFIQKAYLAGAFIGVLCAILGLFLVLRKLSLIGDGLAHVSFGAIALGLFFGLYPFYIAIPVVLMGSYLILKLTQKAKIYGDAAIGIVSSVGIASGVILASASNGFNIDLFSYLFGNILTISDSEVYLAIALSMAVFLVIIIFYNDLLSVTFDEEFARLSGIRADRINLILIFLTAITVVLSIKVVGIMLVSALLIIPAVTSLQIAGGFKVALFISALNSAVSVIIGITLSFLWNVPAGAMIVMINALFFGIALLYKKLSQIY